MNSEEEASYRLTLAEGYLKRAQDAATHKDYLSVISNSQLAVENSAKTIQLLQNSELEPRCQR
ncbi:MAG: hypothetical protein Q6352_016575 [Candidatus Freyrarchaeum guaymaensis]